MSLLTPYEKLSKKAKKEQNAKHRADWNGVKPCTRIHTKKTTYTRKTKHRKPFVD